MPDISYLTRDATEILGAPFYIGLLSNLGILIWSASGAVCLFSSAVLRRTSGSAESVFFLRASGLLSIWLALDDLLTLHEVVLPALGFPQKLVLAAYAGITLCYVIRFRDLIVRTRFLLLAATVSLFGVSIIFDVLQGRLALSNHHYFEDGSKLMGIVGWTAYVITTAMQQLRRTGEDSAYSSQQAA